MPMVIPSHRHRRGVGLDLYVSVGMHAWMHGCNHLIVPILLLLSAAPVRGRHNGFFVSDLLSPLRLPLPHPLP